MIDFRPTPLPCYRCSASTWERVETREQTVRGRVYRDDVVQCCFCGVLERVEAAARPFAVEPQPDRAEFRFQYGRFKGLTLAGADREENGRAYLEHLRDTNDKLRDRIAEYLTKTGLDTGASCGEIVAPSELSGAKECPASPVSSPRLFGSPNNGTGGS
jgi:hypothetical protein